MVRVTPRRKRGRTSRRESVWEPMWAIQASWGQPSFARGPVRDLLVGRGSDHFGWAALLSREPVWDLRFEEGFRRFRCWQPSI